MTHISISTTAVAHCVFVFIGGFKSLIQQTCLYKLGFPIWKRERLSRVTRGFWDANPGIRLIHQLHGSHLPSNYCSGAGFQVDLEVGHLVDDSAVYGEESVGGEDLVLVVDVGDGCFYHYAVVFRDDLASVAPGVFAVGGEGFDFRGFGDCPALDGYVVDELEVGFETEGTGAYGVLIEVGLEEPGFGVYVEVAAYESEAVLSPTRVEHVDYVDHTELF